MSTQPYGIEATSTGVLIRLYVTPRASSNRIIGAHNSEIKVALTAPPVEGAANKALVEFIAKVLGIPKSGVALVSGEASRHKVLRVEGIGEQAVLQKLSSAK